MNHRFYDPARGRFTTPDPAGSPNARKPSYDLKSPVSFNRYAYASDDPVNKYDPSGLDVWVTEDGADGWYYWAGESEGDVYEYQNSDGTVSIWDDSSDSPSWVNAGSTNTSVTVNGKERKNGTA
jgi:RHS repeat-associated protein